MKNFDLTQKRPKVLLFGNGMTYSKKTDWGQIITKLSKENASEIKDDRIPYSVLASIQTDVDDKSRYGKYGDFFQNDYCYKDSPALKELLSIPFDAVLTTNYTYEAEECFVPDFHKKCEKRGNQYWVQTKKNSNQKVDAKYLLHTFNRVSNGDLHQDIWHIHGEARRRTSLILTHDEYSKLIGQLVNYNKERGNDYSAHADDLHFESWMDYLLLGDLHIIGFGFDFSEFDLWWLLARRNRETAETGKLFFYEPEKEEHRAVYTALKAMGAEVEHCGMKAGDEESYQVFYKKAIELIRKA